MTFYLYLAAGLLSGILGGLGMGGGTVLIPILTLLLGVDQHVAQATNLIAFLPMALFSIRVHKDSGLLKTDGLWQIIIPAVITSVLGAIVSHYLTSGILRKLFGAFLVFLAVRGMMTIKFRKSKSCAVKKPSGFK